MTHCSTPVDQQSKKFCSSVLFNSVSYLVEHISRWTLLTGNKEMGPRYSAHSLLFQWQHLGVLSMGGVQQPILVYYKWSYAKGRQRKEDGKPCVTSVTIILFDKTFRQTSPSFKQISLLKTRKQWCQVKITTKHANNSGVKFATHKRFALLLFLPSCCVSSLLASSPIWASEASRARTRVSSRVPFARVLFAISPKWRACSQANY